MLREPLSKAEQTELKRRRRALMRTMGDNSIALIHAARPVMRSLTAEHAYRQSSNFHYLSGFDEPEALLVLVPGRKNGQYLMFCRENDPEKEVWHGRRLGVERAPEVLGADDAFPISDVDEIIPGLLEGRQHVYYTLGKDAGFDAQLLGWLQRARASRKVGASDADAFISVDYHLNEMRLYKSRSELSLMKKAAAVSVLGHVKAMQRCEPGLREHELDAELIGEYRRKGADHAFLPIVGGGVNGCILHYTENADVLNDGDLVLVDSGAELAGYAGDITRTYPVNGRFSDIQRSVYEVVLEAQMAAIAAVKPGNHWNDPHAAAVRVLTKGLRELGVLKGNLTRLIKDEAYKPWYMHRTGHWLGLDTHDVGEYKVDGDWRLLEPGMVLTVEPGLYMGPGTRTPKRLKGIGIRIEDDVIVTPDGADVTTTGVPKTVAAIEALMGVV